MTQTWSCGGPVGPTKLMQSCCQTNTWKQEGMWMPRDLEHTSTHDITVQISLVSSPHETSQCPLKDAGDDVKNIKATFSVRKHAPTSIHTNKNTHVRKYVQYKKGKKGKRQVAVPKTGPSTIKTTLVCAAKKQDV